MLSLLPRLPVGHIRARSLAKARTAPPAGWVPPYSLPAVGQAVAIGTNNAMDVAPLADSWTTSAWDYCNFGSYGGGALVEQWSAGGAYVIAASGGHNHADNPGALLFDFGDATWTRRDNANGAPRKTVSPYSYADGELSGSPWWEITGYSEVPAPAHPYAQHVSAALGSQGSVLLIGRSATGTGANLSAHVHRYDLATRVWSRQSTTALTTLSNGEQDALWDAARQRYWIIPNNPQSYRTVEYLDATDWTAKQTASFDWPSGSLSGSYRTFLHGGLLVRQCGASGLFAFDPDDAAAGWIALTLSGTLPASVNRFVRFGAGNYFWMPTAGGNTLTKLTPPANPKTGTWAISTVSITGATMAGSSQVADHYTRLVYVPAIDCLAWLPGWTHPVYLIKPE